MILPTNGKMASGVIAVLMPDSRTATCGTSSFTADERDAVRLARGDAVGIGDADQQHVVGRERAVFLFEFLLRLGRANASVVSCLSLAA